MPSHILALQRLPLLPNGKLDRQSLPEPQVEAGEYQAPRTEQERLLAELWSELLEQPRIGRDDHFFELGGAWYSPASTCGSGRLCRSSLPLGSRGRRCSARI